MLENISEKKERIIELGLIISLAVLPSFLSALFTYLGLINMDYSSSNIQAVYVLQIATQITILAVFIYVLYRQGRGLDYIGLSFSWKDIFTGFGLLVIAFVSAYLVIFIISFYSLLLGLDINIGTENVELFNTGPVSIMLFLLLIVNSFYEELIVRAYFITEIEDFTKNTTLAVTLCVILQTSYHIYQGIIPLFGIATMFLIFSLYYIKKRRIMPLILAHTYFNIMSVILSRIVQRLVG